MAPATPPRRFKQATLPMAPAPSTPVASPADKRVTRSQTPPPPPKSAARPRRTAVREPYDRHSLEQLKAECERRGLAAREPEDGKRPKQRLIELLQEADLLALFARQAQTKTAPPMRSRSGRLVAPPVPLRVTSHRVEKKEREKKPPRVRKPKAAPLPVAGQASATEPATVAVVPPVNAPVDVPVVSVEPLEQKPEVPVPTEPSPAIHQPETVDLTTELPSTELPAAPMITNAAPAPTPEFVATVPLTEPAPMPLPLTESAPVALPETITPPIQLPAPEAPPARPAASIDANATRARRGCRFRLINVVLSPDFNTRWSEMNEPTLAGEVNAFWRDVHISFLCQNSFYDKVHIDDILFQHVDPTVILNHTAQKLQQMWTEIVSSYRRSHNASVRDGNTKPFLESCGGRLDLVYLYMALELEPELHKAVLAEVPRPRVIPAASTKTTAPAAAKAPNQTKHSAPAKKSTKAPTPPKPVLSKSSKTGTPSMSLQDLEARGPGSGGHEPKRGPRFVELQNPEMLPDWLLEDQVKTAAERGMLVDMPLHSARASSLPTQAQSLQAAAAVPSRAKAKKRAKPKAKQSVPEPAPTQETLDAKSPVQTRDMVLHSSAINSIDDSCSSDYETTDNNIPTIQPTRRRATGKRRRGSSSDLIELPSSRELVPHPHKHLAVTTTMTRSQEMLLPPDEFDVQHNRLRKINESIDQCYRTLSNSDAILNDMHREDIESDLRFYLGIKKRIQEQLVMFMHGF